MALWWIYTIILMPAPKGNLSWQVQCTCTCMHGLMFILMLEFAVFCDVEYKKIIHHFTVRWLSLITSVDRTLSLYPALKSYFLSNGKYMCIITVNSINHYR